MSVSYPPDLTAEADVSSPQSQESGNSQQTASRPIGKHYFLALLQAVIAFFAVRFLLSLVIVPGKALPSELTLLASLLPLNLAAPLAFCFSIRQAMPETSWQKRLQWLPDINAQAAKFAFAPRLIAMTAAALLTALLTHALAHSLGMPSPQQHIITLLQKTSSPILLAAISLTAILLAPLTEEIIFRLGLHESLGIWLSPKAQTLLTALIFAVAHGQIITLPPLFVIGLFLQQAKEVGGLKLSIQLHSAYNALQLAMVFCAQ